MRVPITSDNRELILRIMQDRTGCEAIYHPMPEFSYTVGPYRLTRDGRIEAGQDDCGLFPALAAMKLCAYPCEIPAGDEGPFRFSIENDRAAPLLNLISIVSARQLLLNRALARRNAFFVSRALMTDLLSHPPDTIPEFLQALYRRDEEYRGLTFSLSGFSLTGFRGCRPEEAGIHEQLAGRIVHAAETQKWVKPFTPRVRNQKYAFRSWLNSIGMTGPEYEAARLTLLSRLPGRTDRRKLSAKKGD